MNINKWGEGGEDHLCASDAFYSNKKIFSTADIHEESITLDSEEPSAASVIPRLRRDLSFIVFEHGKCGDPAAFLIARGR